MNFDTATRRLQFVSDRSSLATVNDDDDRDVFQVSSGVSTDACYGSRNGDEAERKQGEDHVWKRKDRSGMLLLCTSSR